MPWAIRLLTFQPVFARNINSCTVPWTIHLLGLRPVFARNINDCMAFWAIRCCPFVDVKNALLNLCHSLNAGVHWNSKKKNSFLLFYSLFKKSLWKNILLNLCHSLNAGVHWNSKKEKFVSFVLFVVKKKSLWKNILLNLCHSLNDGVHWISKKEKFVSFVLFVVKKYPCCNLTSCCVATKGHVRVVPCHSVAKMITSQQD